MHTWSFLAAIALVYTPIILSPGPNFLVLSRMAANGARHHGLWAACGVTSASVLLASLSMFGAGTLLAHSPLMSWLIPVAGGSYLAYKGLCIMLRTNSAVSAKSTRYETTSLISAYRTGLFTNLTNPQTLIFFTSLFAGLLTSSLPVWAKPAGITVIGAISISANIATVHIFSIPAFQQAYLQRKVLVDRIAGVLLLCFSVRIVLTQLM